MRTQATAKQVSKLTRNCRSLKGVSLRTFHACPEVSVVSHHMFTSFFASFGERLLNAELPPLDVQSCTKTAAECPNLRASIVSRNCTGILVFGKQLKKLAIELYMPDWENVGVTIASCRDVESLEVIHKYPLPVAACYPFFGTRLMHLENLVVSFINYHPFHPRSCVFDKIGERTGFLRSVELSCLTIEGGSIFVNLIACNPFLQDVKIVESA